MATDPDRDLVKACRQHIERVRRHGRHMVALIEKIRLRARRHPLPPSPHPAVQRHQHRH